MGDIFDEVDRELRRERLEYKNRYLKIGLAILTGLAVVFATGITLGIWLA